MSKLTIELDPDTHANLKQLAQADERSLTQYIGRVLRQHAGTLSLPTNSHINQPYSDSTINPTLITNDSNSDNHYELRRKSIL